MLLLAVNNYYSVVLDTMARLSKNKKLITHSITTCMYKNSSTPWNNTILWYYLGMKRLDIRRKNNSTPGVLIKNTVKVIIYFPVNGQVKEATLDILLLSTG